MNLANGQGGLLSLNVGGKIFTTNLRTLAFERNSLLKSIADTARDSRTVPFLDRDPECFRHILNYLRTGKLVLPDEYAELELLRHEAFYFKLDGLVGLIEDRINECQQLHEQGDAAGSVLTLQVTLERAERWLRKVTMPALLVPALLCSLEKKATITMTRPLQKINPSLLADVSVTFFLGGRRGILSTSLDDFKQVNMYLRKHCRIQNGYYCNQLLIFTDIDTREELVNKMNQWNANLLGIESEEWNVSAERWLISIS